MKRFSSLSRYVLLLLLLSRIQIGSIIGQYVNYKIYNNTVDISNESVKPVREVKSIENQSIEINYTFSSYCVSDINVDDHIYQIIRIDGFGLSLNTGKPSLPVRTEKIALPSNTEPILSVLASEYIELDGYDIYPAQEMTTDGGTNELSFRKNLATYTSDRFFPKSIATIEDLQIYRNVPLAYIQIHPVQYNPFKKKIRLYKSLVVQIEYKPSTESVSPKIKNNSIQNYSLLNNTVINPSVFYKNIANAKAATSIDPIGYIIVTTPKFEAAADTLARWKGQLGYEVLTLMQDTWSISEVKSAVENAYYSMDPTPSYLVILGDQEDVPDYYYENIYLTPLLPVYSTNYYACMDGSKDYIPEMAHGRISVNSGKQAVMVIQKIVNFERNPPSDPTFYTKGLHAGYFQDSARDGTSDKRYAHTSIETYEYLKNQGYQSDLILYTEPDVIPKRFNSYYSGTTTIPSQYLKENGFAWDGDKNDILNSLNDGRIYAFHRDHGHPNGWVSPHIDTNDFNALTNGNETPIVFSINCASGLFTKPEPIICFSEKLLRYENGGAVGIIAATEETRSGYNDGLIMGMIDAIWPDPGLIPDLGNGGEIIPVGSPHEPIYTLGDVLTQGLIRMTENWDPTGWADKDHFHLYHYFGDPAMQFWTDIPTTIWANHTNSVDTSTTSITVSSSNCSDGLATVCTGDELLACARLNDGTGKIQLPEPLGKNTPEIKLTLSKHNYIPYVAKLSVEGAISSELPEPPGNFTTQLVSANTIELKWEDNASNEITYLLQRSINDGSYITIVELPQNTQSYIDKLNQFGAKYRYRIKAVNSIGSSDFIYSDSVWVPESGPEKIAGFDEIFASMVYNDYRRAQQITMPEDGTITKIVMYHGGGGGSLIFAVYANSGDKPGDLLSKTAITSVKRIEGWQEAELETPVFVSANSIIWLAWIYEYSPALYYTQGGPGRAHSDDKWSAKMPSYFGTSRVSGYTYSIYVLYTGTGVDSPPQAPLNFYLTYNESIPIIHLGWTDNSDNENGFILERKVNAGDFVTLYTLNANDTSYSDYSIEYNQLYQYRVKAFNANGESDYSDIRTVNTTYLPPSAPDAPTELTGLFNETEQKISLNWKDNSPNEDEFILERKVNSGSFEQLSIVSANTTDFTDSYIVYDQLYTYRVYANNLSGSSDFSNEYEINTYYDPEPDPDADIVGYNEIFSSPTYNDYRRAQCVEMPEDGTLLTISMYHGGGRGYVLYAVYDDDDGRPGDRLGITAVTPTNYSEGWQEIDLEIPVFVEQGTRIWLAWVYQYSPRLFYTSGGLGRAHSEDKWSSKMPLSFGYSKVSGYKYSIHAIYQTKEPDLKPPDQPSSLTASLNISIPFVTLHWTDNSYNENGFSLERSINGGPFQILTSLSENETEYSDYDLKYSTEYAYRVYGFNAFGNSLFSNTTAIFTSPIGMDPILVGNTEILPIKVYSSYRRAQPVTIPEDGSIESITMYHGPGQGYLLFGVYADNNSAPGALLSSTYVTPNSPLLGWQTVELTNPLSVEAGQGVWLAWVFTNGTDIYYGNGTPGRANSGEFWSGQLPDPFGPATFSNYIYSIYLMMYPGGTPKSGELEGSNLSSNAFLLIYPKPVTDDVFYYSLQNISEADVYYLEIVDMTGRMIQKRKVWIEPGVEYYVQLHGSMDSNLLIFRLYNEEYTHIKKVALSLSN